MKVGKLVLTEAEGVALGKVEITTGMLWWRKTEWRRAFRLPDSEFWRWLDTGEFAPRELRDREIAARVGQ